MNTVCPKCGCRRGPEEVVPDYECPRCGVVYEKYLAAMARRERDAAAGHAEETAVGLGSPETTVAGDASTAGASRDVSSTVKRSGQDAVRSSGPGEHVVPEAPGYLADLARPANTPSRDAALLSGASSSSDASPLLDASLSPEASTPWLRYLGLGAAFLLLVGVIALSARERRGTAGGASGPGQFAGVYEGSTTREIALASGEPYESEYLARFTVGEDGRIAEITWTDGSYLLDLATVSWSSPARTEYTQIVREDYSRSFEDPPGGEYTRFTREGSSYRVESVHAGNADLRRFEYNGEIPLAVGGKERATTGALRASKTEAGAFEAVIRTGLPQMGRVEVEPGAVTCELTPSLANRALLPYLQGKKSLPDGSPVDAGGPNDGVDIERVMVPRWPGRLWVNFYGVRVGAAVGVPGAERLPQVDVIDGSRVALDFADPIGWEARVVFLADGRAVVRIPVRNLEIPVTKVEEVTAAQP